MPSKKLTIKDFVFSLKNTVMIKTSHRIKNCKLNLVSVNFTANIDKNYKQIIIHSIEEDLLFEFIDKLNSILSSLKINLIDKNNIMFKKQKQKESLDNNQCYWYNMPEFKTNEHMLKHVTLRLEIETIDTQLYNMFIKNFYETFNIILWPKVKFFWYPDRPKLLSPITNQLYVSTDKKTIKYPIYIISKGRAEKRYTSKYLEWCNIDYKIVIEPQEYFEYAKYIDESKILLLTQDFLNKNQGSIPARNFVWKHSTDNGHKRHWILDDNIVSYKRFNNGQKIITQGSCVFRVVEDYVDRFSNIKMAGHNYTMFGISTNTNIQVITKNTRIYSSILLSNDIFPEYQWRGKYNEDTDLSLRILKAGYPTVLFNCFLADKLKTLTQKGGNTDSVYAENNGILLKAESIVEQHKDVSQIITRFGRVHHYIDYSKFKNLKLIPHISLDEEKNNEYGMKLVSKDINFTLYDTDPSEKEDTSNSECTTTTSSEEVHAPSSEEVHAPNLVINDSIIKEFLLLPNIKQLLNEYVKSKDEADLEIRVKEKNYKQRRDHLYNKFKKNKKGLVDNAVEHYGLIIKDIKNKTVEKIIGIINNEENKRNLYENFAF
jgi:hypothetical protein